jgi:gas vesicle protein
MDLSNSWFQGTVFLLAGAAIGGVVGWATSAYFARESDRDTQRELRMMTTLLLTAEEQGLVKLARDAKGEITGGRIIELRAAAQSTSGASADLTIGPRAPDHK